MKCLSPSTLIHSTLEVGHAHEVRGRDPVLLRRPDLEDRVLVGELDEVQPLHGHTEVVLGERAGAALHRLCVLLLRTPVRWA